MTDTNQEVRETPEIDNGEVFGVIDLPTKIAIEIMWYSWAVGDTDDEHARRFGEVQEIVAANIASASPPAVPDVVGVQEAKSLDWRPHGMPGTTARTPFGDYRIDEEFWLGCIWLGRKKFDTLEEAKAAAQADFDRRILSSIEPTLSSEPQDDAPKEFEQEDTEITWRDLALQFDGQRILALQLLRAMVDEPGRWQDEAAEFVKAPPLSGEAVLAERIAALSPEPQASNAGAPVMWICEFFSEDGSLLERRITEDRERLPKFVPPGSTLKITPLFVAFTTPEPQTGERDGEAIELLAYRLRNEVTIGSGTVSQLRKDAADALLAERTAREADILAIDGIRAVAATASKHRGNIGKEAEFLAVILARAEAALIGEVRKHPDHVEAERRLAEMEERAREDTLDNLMWRLDHVRTPYCMQIRQFLIERGAMRPDSRAKARAALRAKPEAQAIVGKEGQS